MSLPIDYDILRLIWWLFLGVLLIGFAIMDGFDLGVAALLTLVGRTDTERRIALNSIGPVWDGNQVWFILGGGAIFAAWPLIYATAFSGFYIALFLVLLTLILRPTGFEFRNKAADPRWRSFWDYALTASGVVPSLVFGVAVGNLFLGVPFRFDNDMRVFYEGTGLFELLNPFGLLAGLVSLIMIVTHGAVYLQIKAEGPVQQRARAISLVTAPLTIVLFAIAGAALFLWIDGYAITSAHAVNGPSDPLAKTVVRQPGAWLGNFKTNPLLWIAPALGLALPLLTMLLCAIRRPGLAFFASALTIASIIATAGLSLFPFLMPSNLSPQASLTVWDASSSALTLFAMLVATLIFLPIVLIYTSIIFRVLRGKVTAEQIETNSRHVY